MWHASSNGALIQTYKRLDTLAGGAFPPGQTPVIDLQTIVGEGFPLSNVASSQTSGNPACPSGYSVIDKDINKGAGGSYSYICFERATTNTGPLLRNVTVAIAASNPQCAPGWTLLPGNLKEGTQSPVVIQLCALVGVPAADSPVVTGLTVAQGGTACPDNYVETTGDISGGVGQPEVLCALFTGMSSSLPSTGSLPRLPREFRWSTERPADKRALTTPARRKPLEKAVAKN